MANIDIHIGTHKTASTAIQHALETAINANVSEGWHYVRFGMMVASQLHGQLMKATSSVEAIVDQLRLGIEAALESGENQSRGRLVVSWEGLSGNPLVAYQNSAAIAAMLREATSEHSVRIIVYLRRQDEFIESMYTQTIHEVGSDSFDHFFADFNANGILDYDAFLRSYECMFGFENIIVRSYHAAAKAGMIADFGGVIGSKLLNDHRSTTRRNRSYSRVAIEIARSLNDQLTTEQQKRLRQALQNASPRRTGESLNLFSQQQRKEYLQRCADSNAAVASKYFGGDVTSLFPIETEATHLEAKSNLQAIQIAEIVPVLKELLNSPVVDEAKETKHRKQNLLFTMLEVITRWTQKK